MKTIEIQKLKNCDELIGKVPIETQSVRIVSPPAKFVIGGKCLGIYARIPKQLLKGAHDVVELLNPKSGKRTQGVPVKSSIFGSLPRVPIRNYYCRLSADSLANPDLYAWVMRFSQQVSELYAQHLPESFEQHRDLSTSEIHEDWIIPGTPFTTVNFNVNHAIRYHRDAANQKGVWSNVVILKKKTEGGLLVFPEFGIALSQCDGAIALFDGQSLIHGVSPIRVHQGGYRCSVVLYALDQFRNCYPFSEELEAAKVHRTKVESAFNTDALKLRVDKGHNANERLAKQNRRKKNADFAD